MLSELELALRLLLAAVLGAVVGIEREWRDRTAGLRTHMLVCLGSAVFTIVSAYGFQDWYTNIPAAERTTVVSDPTRIAAQIVTGIGFLGAGAIFRSDDGIRGLTTAASLWMMAATGLAIGAGFYELAIGGTLLVLIILVALRQVSGWINRLHRDGETSLEVVVSGLSAIGLVFDAIASVDGSITDFTASLLKPDQGSRKLDFAMSLPPAVSVSDIVGRIALLEGVESITAPDVPQPKNL